MKEMTVSEALAALRKTEELLGAYNHALGVLYLDATTAAPKGTSEGRGRTMGALSGVTYDLTADPALGELIAFLGAHAGELDERARREVELMRKQHEQISRIPAQEYIDYTVLVNKAQSVWAQAKTDNDFAAFAPYLEKIVDTNRRFAGYFHPEMAPYDALLNEYEEGLDTKTLDAFFAELRATIVPLIRRVQQAPPIENGFLHAHYPVEKQRLLSDYLMQVLGLDRDHCGIAETEHPYTTSFNHDDVRITTHYFEDDVASSMYSVIHEGGHAIYELGIDPDDDYTALSGGVSMGIHESQSRFFENLIGRSEAFITAIWPKLTELFPEQLAGVDAHAFYRAVNRAEPSLIRTEADELTYCMHVMVRYELEKRLIAGDLSVADLPAAWNALYKEYLGIDVPDDRRGCLQDSHWSGGSIGYFPSYALGSAYGPQILHMMERDLGDIYADVAEGDLSRIKAWLREHIHRYGCLYPSGELFTRTCGQFDARYYTDYLVKKYTELYGL